MGSAAMIHFLPYKDRVKDYCLKNGLDYNKLISCFFGMNNSNLSFAHPDNLHDGSNGLIDDTPMPCVLWIDINTDGSLNFRQTEYTQKYISA
jgi:hypothetical protein